MESSKSRHEEPAIKRCGYVLKLYQLNPDKHVHAIEDRNGRCP